MDLQLGKSFGIILVADEPAPGKMYVRVESTDEFCSYMIDNEALLGL